MEKHAAERVEDGSKPSMDRISQLRKPILHHILCFLSQKEAIQTCVLSKSWRYLGSTRPNIEFCELDFGGDKETFMSVLDNTLQRYHDQKLSVQEFCLAMTGTHYESKFLLQRIPIVLMNMGVKTLNLKAVLYHLPSFVFQSEFLTELTLRGCNLNKISSTDTILLKRLQTLSLERVHIAQETLDKILSSCPLIEHLVLHMCEGLTTIKVNKARNLKHFGFSVYDENPGSTEFDVPSTLETIRIEYTRNRFEHYNNVSNNIGWPESNRNEHWSCSNKKCFPHLEFLYLYNIQLVTESFHNFSSNFPCLKEFKLHLCFGFEEFKLSSTSIKRLTIQDALTPIKVAIDAPNILYFKFSSIYLPSITFTTTSSEWKSHIVLSNDLDFNPPLLLKLTELLKALSQSQISLDLCPVMYNDIEKTDGGSYKPVVEHLRLKGFYSSPSSTFPDFLNYLFRICRPRCIVLCLHNNAMTIWESESYITARFLWRTIQKDRETRQCNFMQKDLEELRIEVSDDNGKEWHSVHEISSIECALSNNQNIRYRLKWRDLS